MPYDVVHLDLGQTHKPRRFGNDSLDSRPSCGGRQQDSRFTGQEFNRRNLSNVVVCGPPPSAVGIPPLSRSDTSVHGVSQHFYHPPDVSKALSLFSTITLLGPPHLCSSAVSSGPKVATPRSLAVRAVSRHSITSSGPR